MCSIAPVKRFGLIRFGDDASPVGNHFFVGPEKLDIGVAAFVRNNPPSLFQTLVERGPGQSVEDVDSVNWRLRFSYECGDCLWGLPGVGVETYYEAGSHFQPIAVELIDCLQNRLLNVDSFLDGAQSGGFGSFYAAKNVSEICVMHEIKDIRVLRQGQCRLAAQTHLAIPFILPDHQVIEQFASSLWVGDEIVVHKIDRRRSAGRQDIQFADNLRRGLMAGTATVESRDVAELAPMRAAAGELHRAEEVVADIDQVIGWCGKLGHWQASGKCGA